MSKRFMHVALGILALALAYHFALRTATAQSGGVIECAGVEAGDGAAAVIDRHLWIRSGVERPYRIDVPIPGASAVIACSVNGVLLQDGSMYTLFTSPGAPEWGYRGAFPTGTTSAQSSTFGRLKARYRGDSR